MATKQFKTAIIQFPATNYEWDCLQATREIIGMDASVLWHGDTNLKLDEYDLVILPGGYSYGDYLRAGAMAQLSPSMPKIVEFANAGGLVFGICNGFQILTEIGLLPGALITNACRSFLCQDIYLRFDNAKSPFSNQINLGDVVKMQIAHHQGCYYLDSTGLDELEVNNQILLRYCTKDGELSDEANPNGSLRSIAGITNKAGNVAGMMPHPECSCEEVLGSIGGKTLFNSLLASKVA